MIKLRLAAVCTDVCAGVRACTTWLAARPALSIVLSLALLLRVATLLWGLPGGPNGGLHADESKYLGPALHFVDFYLTGRPFPLYGTALQYTIGALLAPFDVVARLTGHAAAYAVMAGAFARLVVALLGTIAVALTYRLAELVCDQKTALFAAAFLAVAPFHVLNSSWFTLDVPMATLLLVNLLLVLELTRRERPALYAAWGLAFGYMLGMKLTAAVFLVLPLALALNGSWPARSSRRRGLAVFACVALATFAVLDPQFFLAFDLFLERVAVDKVDFWDRTAPDSSLQAAAMHWQGYVSSVGLPLALAALGGMVVGLWRMPKFTWACLAFLCVYGLYFRHYMLGRYVIFVTPLLCLYAGLLCAALTGRSSMPARSGGAAAAAVIFVVTAYAAGSGIASRWLDPRILAARFVAAQYPPGTTVALAVDSEKYPGAQAWQFPTLHNDEHVRVSVLDSPAVVITSSGVMSVLEEALASEYLHADGTWAPQANYWWYRHSPPSPALFEFYRRFLRGSDYELVRTFELPVDAGLADEFFMVDAVSVYERR